MGQRVTFVTQPTQEGFGHAVFRTQEAVGNEPFLLMLGDHLYRSHEARSCARQLVEAYEQYDTSVLGLRLTPEDEIVSYGAAAGIWLTKPGLLALAELIEKPSVDYARANLRVPGLPEREYLTFFGLYIIKPRVFDFLKEHIADDRREGGEFELTTALERLRREDGFLGLIIDGDCYDIGLPDAYLHALVHLRRD
jgi:UTP--glucose-1-phosphate uridylyltransferase